MSKEYSWAEDPRPICVIPDGGFSSLSQISNDCKFPQDYTGPLLTLGSQVVDKHGHELYGDWDPKAKNGCDHRDTPEWQAEHKKLMHKPVHKKVEKVAVAGVQAPAPTQGTVEVKSADPVVKEQIKGESLSSLPILFGMLSGIVGSAIGPAVSNIIKKQVLKSLKKKKGGPSKEEEGKELDCKTHNLQCNTRSAKFSAELAEIKTKLETITNSDSSSGRLSIDNLEELQERVEKLEKRIKKIN